MTTASNAAERNGRRIASATTCLPVPTLSTERRSMAGSASTITTSNPARWSSRV